jgi:hypothetical protein
MQGSDTGRVWCCICRRQNRCKETSTDKPSLQYPLQNTNNTEEENTTPLNSTFGKPTEVRSTSILQHDVSECARACLIRIFCAVMIGRSERYKITEKLHYRLTDGRSWDTEPNLVENRVKATSDAKSFDWTISWIGESLECISLVDNNQQVLFYATEDLDRCLFIAHMQEKGIKQRMEILPDLTVTISQSRKWIFFCWEPLSTFSLKKID